jgi:hypothetical protein
VVKNAGFHRDLYTPHIFSLFLFSNKGFGPPNFYRRGGPFYVLINLKQGKVTPQTDGQTDLAMEIWK